MTLIIFSANQGNSDVGFQEGFRLSCGRQYCSQPSGGDLHQVDDAHKLGSCASFITSRTEKILKKVDDGLKDRNSTFFKATLICL